MIKASVPRETLIDGASLMRKILKPEEGWLLTTSFEISQKDWAEVYREPSLTRGEVMPLAPRAITKGKKEPFIMEAFKVTPMPVMGTMDEGDWEPTIEGEEGLNPKT